MATNVQPTGKLIVGYFPGWAIHARNYHVSDIPADKLTHVVYAFAGVSDGGECVSVNSQDDEINFPALQLSKRQQPNLRTLISIGGASHSGNFSKATGTVPARQSLAQSCVSFMKVSGFDGIDIDWEFPGPADTLNYTALLKELRSQLDVQGTADGKQYLLTAALPAGPVEYAHFDIGQIHQSLDWLNLMTYDFYTSSNPSTEFSAPLYPSSTNPADPKKRASYNVDAAVKAYVKAGAPAAKIVVGVSFFGYGWEGVSKANNGLYQSASGPAQGTWKKDGVFDFKDLASNYVGTYLRYWNVESAAPWLYNPDTGIMISYDDAQSLGLKADYVNANNLAGSMIWQLSADDSQSSLVSALSASLNPSQAGGPNPSPSPQPVTAPKRSNETRRIPKATYVPLIVPIANSVDNPPGVSVEGRAVLKFGYIRRLALQPGEVDAVQGELSRPASLAAGGTALLNSTTISNTKVWDTLRSFEGSPMPSQLPAPGVFANIPSGALMAFGKAIVSLRQQSLDRLKQQAAGAPDPSPPTVLASELTQQPTRSLTRIPGNIALTSTPMSLDLSTSVGKWLNLINLGIGATNGFEANVTATPVGMLNLERLEMTPAGIERGGLLATIPLAPKEQTAVVQKEWSVTTKEFTSIVTDSLENYSETGVTENTDLSQSTTSQTQHSNQFNINSTVQGSYAGFVTGSVSAGFTAQDSNSQSATDSRKHAIATTRKASARVKQEHKMSISTTTVTGTSETTTRILQNPSDTNPIRIDYFSMIRKWRVGLYRYGLRLTYDISIPEPGGTLREAYMQLADLQLQAARGFNFPLTQSDITQQNYENPSSALWAYANQWGVLVPPPPAPGSPLMPNMPATGIGTGGWQYFQLPFSVPENQWVIKVTALANINTLPNKGFYFAVEATPFYDGPNFNPKSYSVDLTGQYHFMEYYTGQQTVTFWFNDAGAATWVGLIVQIAPTLAAVQQWVSEVWNALYNAAQAAFYAQQQAVNAQIQALQDQLNNVDTLTLRREENDEIMKGVLRWLLGPLFEFMPPDVQALFGAPLVAAPGCGGASSTRCDLLTHGVSFTGNDIFGDDTPQQANYDWSTMFLYQEMVKFINEAIEWENVLYFLYSYFWDVPASWDFIRQIRHPDSTRQAFLRAGSARVVLTVRRGWEPAWVSFVETGGFGQTLLPNHPYMSIVQEIQAYDNTNYPGIPAANPASGPTSDQEDSVATTSHALVPASATPSTPVNIPIDTNPPFITATNFIVGYTVVIDSYGSVATISNSPTPGSNGNPVSIPVNSSAGFVVGVAAVIDSADSGVQETQTVTGIPDATHITVQMLKNDHYAIPFPIVQNIQESQIITAIPDATHITVQKLNYPHDGRTTPFPVVQPGEKGILISEWFEYTPTSGTDIAVTSNLATIS
jgi:GH18 family chitinase